MGKKIGKLIMSAPLLLLFFFLGCTSQKDNYTQVAENLFIAQANSNWQEYCQLITTKSAQLTTELISYEAGRKYQSCEEAISSLPKSSKKRYSQGQFAESAKGARVIQKIAENKGQVALEVERQGLRSKLLLYKEGEKWGVVLPIELRGWDSNPQPSG